MYSEIVFQDRWIFYKHLFCKNSSEAFTKFNNLEAYTLMYNFRGDKKHLVEGNRYLINPGRGHADHQTERGLHALCVAARRF